MGHGGRGSTSVPRLQARSGTHTPSRLGAKKFRPASQSAGPCKHRSVIEADGDLGEERVQKELPTRPELFPIRRLAGGAMGEQQSRCFDRARCEHQHPRRIGNSPSRADNDGVGSSVGPHFDRSTRSPSGFAADGLLAPPNRRLIDTRLAPRYSRARTRRCVGTGSVRQCCGSGVRAVRENCQQASPRPGQWRWLA